ncbi:MAG: hypothetical protein JMDDDDMK_02273 [Acidobacteria bacterium]|nr:hypothetical protein [Acidobacteriota bacterium]
MKPVTVVIPLILVSLLAAHHGHAIQRQLIYL